MQYLNLAFYSLVLAVKLLDKMGREVQRERECYSVGQN